MADGNFSRMLPHLEFHREQQSAERHKPARKFKRFLPEQKRPSFATSLELAIANATAEARDWTKANVGIKPHLILKLPIVSGCHYGALETVLEQSGMVIVSIEPNNAIVVFENDIELTRFRQAIESYRKGPQKGINKATSRAFESTKFDVLQMLEVEHIKPWEKSDRLGSALSVVLPVWIADGNEEIHAFDLELWHPGTSHEAKELILELREFINLNTGSGVKPLITDQFVGESLLMLRLKSSVSFLQKLFDLPIVREIELPPKPELAPAVYRNLTARDFAEPRQPPRNGPRVCVIDSGITTGHPLLSSHVGHAEAILTAADSVADAHGHGTMVAAIAVFGDIQDCINSGKFESPVTVFSARVLNDNNEFDDDKLIVTQLRESIEFFYAPPYNCRVFNLSIQTSVGPFSDSATLKQSYVAEAIDELARKFKVLLVVSAGNALPNARMTAEQSLTKYPKYLFDESARLSDPGSSAIGLTVGALAASTSIFAPYLATNDFCRPIAKLNQPGPYTRIGPGLNGAVKPDLVEYGGNLVFEGVGNNRRIASNTGCAIVSFHNRPEETLFGFTFGTSFAAPKVSRIAAMLHDTYKKQTGEEPHPNTLRALLANSATVPLECSTLFKDDKPYSSLRVCGFGLPEEEKALFSSPNRVTLVAQSELALDYFHIYGIPVTEAFIESRGERTISLALAYDPPVRRTRLDYLGVEMSMLLLRGLTLEQVFDQCRQAASDESIDRAFPDKFKIKLQPPSFTRSGINQKRGTLQKGMFTIKAAKVEDYGNMYWLVVRAERRWASVEILSQTYSVAVTIEASSSKLYESVRQNIRVRARVEQRVQNRL